MTREDIRDMQMFRKASESHHPVAVLSQWEYDKLASMASGAGAALPGEPLISWGYDAVLVDGVLYAWSNVLGVVRGYGLNPGDVQAKYRVGKSQEELRHGVPLGVAR